MKTTEELNLLAVKSDNQTEEAKIGDRPAPHPADYPLHFFNQKHIDGLVISRGDSDDLPDGTTHVQSYYEEDNGSFKIWNTTTESWDILGNNSLITTGWYAASGTWTYATWTSGTRIGTITVPTGATSTYQAGMRIKITQSTGGTKYGIIQKVEATTLTVFFKNSTTLNNETISSPYFSLLKVPFGFDASPAQWLVETLITSDVSIESGTTYANTGSQSLAVGIGAWIKEYRLSLHIDGNATTEVGGYVTLSTANNSESDQEMTSLVRIFTNQTAGDLQLYHHVSARKSVEVTAAETWYLNAKGFSGVTYGVYEILGASLKSYIRATNAYL